MRSSRYLREILALDPVRDAQRIVYLDTVYEFPFDTTRALEFAFFRTFGSPAISSLLDSTGEFGARGQKRYDDTDLILSTIAETGYDSQEGKRALRRMNGMHRRFEIANDDYPLRPLNYGRRADPVERALRLAAARRERAPRHAPLLALARPTDGDHRHPEDFAEFERYNVEYERARFRYAESNQRVTKATRDMFLAWFPGAPKGLGAHVIASLVDDRLREAIGFPRPPRVVARGVEGSLRARPRRAAPAAGATPAAAYAAATPLVPERLRRGRLGDYAAERRLRRRFGRSTCRGSMRSARSRASESRQS